MKFNDYEAVIAWIHGTLRLGIKPGLGRMEFLLKRLNNPERSNKWIHVAGTNGKGSTVTFIREILEHSGYKVGTFTSPYIETFNERICVNGHPIPDEDLVTIANLIYPITIEMKESEFGSPSEFEIITAMMFVYFAEVETIDLGVIEVGLGGRLDSTNVLTPLISVITTIGMDHMEFLGNNLAAIAKEKAGIIKASIPIISGVLQSEASEVIEMIARDRQAPLYKINKDFDIKTSTKSELRFVSRNIELPDLKLGLEGKHQYHNAALAVETVLLLAEITDFSISNQAIKSGLANAFWPGRMETISNNPLCILDGAHNPEGVQAFADNASAISGDKVILCSILGDKDHRQMLATLKSIPNAKVYLTTFDYPRAMDQEELRRTAEIHSIEAVVDWKSWLQTYWSQEELEKTLFITGSLYFISEVRHFIKNGEAKSK